LGFNSIIRSNISVGISFSETLITDVVGETNGTSGFNVVDGGCDGKVGKFSCGFVKNEDEAKNVALANFSAVVEDDSVLKAADSFLVTKDDSDDSRVSDVATYRLQDGIPYVEGMDVKAEESLKQPAFLSDAKLNVIQDQTTDISMLSNVNYRVSDLVWGKVRGHSWWPGQIYDPSVASVKAKRHRKGNCYLIAYFGDQTFAWNDVSMIKPFHKHFTEMEKQNDLKIFRHAVDCALEEASRRVEFGLSCPCMPGQASPKLKTILNANAATSLEPMELVNFVKSLAQSSLTEFDRLEFVSARAQLSAFYRSKGYSQLPEFAMLDRLFENDKEILPEREKHQCDGQINDQVLMKTYDGFSQKSEHIAWNTKQTGKTKKLLPRKKAGDNSILRHGRKRKAAHDTTYEYFHPSQITDDISTSQRRRKGKAAYDTSDVTSTEVAATSSMSTPTPVELCYDSHWTDRYFLM